MDSRWIWAPSAHAALPAVRVLERRHCSRTLLEIWGRTHLETDVLAAIGAEYTPALTLVALVAPQRQGNRASALTMLLALCGAIRVLVAHEPTETCRV